MEQTGSQENLPLDILYDSQPGPSVSPANTVRINVPAPLPPFDVSHLPSRMDPYAQPASVTSCVEQESLHVYGGQRVSVRRRTLNRQRSTAASMILRDLPSHRPTRGDGGTHEGLETTPLFTTQACRASMTLDEQAEYIVLKLEENPYFDFNIPQWKNTLKEMPEPLSLKRTVCHKLMATVSQKSIVSPIGWWKSFKYHSCVALTKIIMTVATTLYSIELWYQSLKVIEGHFGSGVATYFKFLRWLFLFNLVFCIGCVSFITLPQLLYHPHDQLSWSNATTDAIYRLFDLHNNSTTHAVGITAFPTSTESPAGDEVQSKPDDGRVEFSFSDIFTGEGFFTDTTLYYGFYTNDTLHTSTGSWYSIPNAYFFTMVAMYAFVFIVLSTSMARSYRRSFIETAGDQKNVYVNKVFCGWDFNISSSESAKLQAKSLYNEFKELLGDDLINRRRNSICECYTKALTKCTMFGVCLGILGVGALFVWVLLQGGTPSLVVSFIITIIMILAPKLFTCITDFEGYRSPRACLYVTLLRTFALMAVIVAVLVTFWLTTEVNSTQCWETALAQEVYRLVVMDFWIAIIGTAIAEFLRSSVNKYIWDEIGAPEFDIARNTLNLIYNQTLFWIGAFFSPLLAVIIVIKMAITFYIKKVCVLHNCQPASRAWRAAQTQTVFLVLAFLSLLGIIISLGYILTQVRPSENCGPFRNLAYIYEIILTGVFKLGDGSFFRKLIMYLTRPGVVGGVLLAMATWVYYMRAKAHAHRDLVKILKGMLKLEALDKEFLLVNISNVTGADWMQQLGNLPEKSRAPYQATGHDMQDDLNDSSTSQTSRDWMQKWENLLRKSRAPSQATGHDMQDDLNESSTSQASRDGNLDLSDEELNLYDSTRIRALRRKHIKD